MFGLGWRGNAPSLYQMPLMPAPSKHILSQLWDIEVCTPVETAKRLRLHTPLHLSLVRMPQPIGAEAAPLTPVNAKTAYFVGSSQNTFRNPLQCALISPRVSVQLLKSLKSAQMEDTSRKCLELGSPHSSPSTPSTESTIIYSTEGSRCVTPHTAADGNGGLPASSPPCMLYVST